MNKWLLKFRPLYAPDDGGTPTPTPGGTPTPPEVPGGGTPTPQEPEPQGTPTPQEPTPTPTPTPTPEPTPTPRPSDDAAGRIAALVAARHASNRERDAAIARANLAEETLRAIAQTGQVPGETPGAPAAPRALLPPIDREAIIADVRFNERCNSIAAQGKDAHADFPATLTQLQTLAGGQLPRGFVEAVLATDAPVEVLYALGKDPERADALLSLQGEPMRLVAELTKVAISAKGPKGREISQVPPPIRGAIGGAGGGNAPPSDDIYDPNISTERFMQLRNAQDKAAREARQRR